jgi:uncharacterized SAM-binding protein YcdF (DUF218 family)
VSHAFNQAVGLLSSPLLIALWLAAVAAALAWRGRPRAGRTVLACAAVVAYLFCTPLVGRALLRPLEDQYPAMTAPPPPVGYIVVLGSGYVPHPDMPVTAALDSEGLTRIVEGLRLLRQLPAARLVVSGAGLSAQGGTALGYAQLAQALGIPADRIIVLDRPHDTRAEASEVARLTGSMPFVLVTSAYHMPRAVLLSRRSGAQLIAAPTGQRTTVEQRLSWRDFLPGSGGLRDCELALHEYLGLLAIAVGL